MSARKAYFRILIVVIIYSSRILHQIPFGGAAFVLLSHLLFFLWAIYPIVFGNKSSVRPFHGDSSAQNLLLFFILWQMFVIFRGIVINLGLPFGLLGDIYNPHGILAYLLPLIVFLNPNQFQLKQMVSVMTIMGFVFILFLWFNRGFLFSSDFYDTTTIMTEDILEQKGVWISSVQYVTKLFQMMGFLMFIPSFIGKKRYWFVLLCWGMALFCSVMGGRRGASVTLILMALFSIYFYAHKGKSSAAWLKYTLLLFAVFAIGYYVYSSYSSMFSIMENRINADSRTEIVVAFWADMGSGVDWIWGRGLGGQYYCPMSHNNGDFVYYRNVIENGYLFIILSGGVISLILYLAVLFTALRKGFFHTNNQLTKAFAAYIGVSLFNLIPFGLPEFSITFFVVWVGVAICGSPYYRKMTDSEIRQLFN